MIYVKPDDVIRNFRNYIGEYDEKVVPVDVLLDELQDAIDDAEYIVVED